MTTFGLITEGITDQKVIEKIVYGFFNSPDVPINPLSPLRDATDENRANTNSNWLEVFNYCGSEKFRTEVFLNDYLIIQIDSDALKGDSVPEKFKIAFPQNSGVNETVDAIKNKIIELIGDELYNSVSNKIIFAISVEQIECWLLPIYYPTQKAKAAKITGCLRTLNEALNKTESFFIDKDNKNPKYYSEIAHHYRKQKGLLSKAGKLNPSLNLFLENLETVNFSEI